MLPSETMIWQPEFTDKTLSRKPGAVHSLSVPLSGIRTHRNNRGSISGLELCQEGFLSPSLTGSVSEQEH
ncbi:hypothetical protein, partial [Escherichia coli]|uniref:hypothetical protein n=1 Tax=Escherichia coli TaxID=562 RepID=UPI00196585E1